MNRERVIRGRVRVPALILLIVVTAGATSASAQGWPAAGIHLTTGISRFEGRGYPTVAAQLSRRWGPLVGAAGADLWLSQGSGKPPITYNPFSGEFYCGARRVDDRNTNCTSSLTALGGAVAEVGIVLDRFVPFVVSRGYRFGPVADDYYAFAFHGGIRITRTRWLGRVAIGKRTTQFMGGVVIDLDITAR